MPSVRPIIERGSRVGLVRLYQFVLKCYFELIFKISQTKCSADLRLYDGLVKRVASPYRICNLFCTSFVVLALDAL